MTDINRHKPLRAGNNIGERLEELPDLHDYHLDLPEIDELLKDVDLPEIDELLKDVDLPEIDELTNWD